MADAITNVVSVNSGTGREYMVFRTCVSDGTGEVAAIVINLSTLTLGALKEIPVRCIVKDILLLAQGFTSVRLAYDRAPDQPIANFPGNGVSRLDVESVGGIPDLGAGDTGNVLVTTFGAVAGATYTLALLAELSNKP